MTGLKSEFGGNLDANFNMVVAYCLLFWDQ